MASAVSIELLKHFLSVPLLPGERIEHRMEDVRAATPLMNDEQRLKAVLSTIVRPVDLERALVKAPHRPGLLTKFALLHTWMWNYHNGKLTCIAHDPLRAAYYETLLLREMHKKGGNNATAGKIISKRFLGDQNNPIRNPWHVPLSATATARVEAARQITAFYQKHRDRKRTRIKQLTRPVVSVNGILLRPGGRVFGTHRLMILPHTGQLGSGNLKLHTQVVEFTADRG